MKFLRNLKRAFVYSLPETLWAEYLVAFLYYFVNIRKFPNLKTPKNFNEKTLWRRLNEREIDYAKYVDKYEVRKHIEKTIGNDCLVPVIGVYENAEEIDFNSLPNKFIIKTTHGSGGNIVCIDKSNFNWVEAKNKVKEYLKTSYYRQTREFGYKNIKPRVICEELLEDNIIDYKFFCYDGEPKFIEIDTNRYTGHLRSFYKANWEEVKNAKMTYPNIPSNMLEKPSQYDKMLEICRILSAEFNFVRVDLYHTNNKIYFGELTFFHTGGVEKIIPEEFNIELAKPLKLKMS